MLNRLKLLVVVCAALSGCAEFDPIETPNPSEMARNERGLFSGEDGVFTVPLPDL